MIHIKHARLLANYVQQSTNNKDNNLNVLHIEHPTCLITYYPRSAH